MELNRVLTTTEATIFVKFVNLCEIPMSTTTAVFDAIVETYRVTISFEDKVNRLLDRLLALREPYRNLNAEWRNVNELIEKYVSECPSAGDLTVLSLNIDGLIKSGESLRNSIQDNLVKVLPSILTDIDNNLDHIREIQVDIRIKLSDLPELLSVEEKLIKDLGF